MRGPITYLAAVVLAVAACGGNTGDTGSVPAQNPTTTSGASLGDSTDPGSAPPGSGDPDCATDRISEVDYKLTEIPIVEDDELEQIVVSGGTAYVTTDSGSVLEVDLVSGSVTQVYQFNSKAIDGNLLWVLTLDGPVSLADGFFSGNEVAAGEGVIWMTAAGSLLCANVADLKSAVRS